MRSSSGHRVVIIGCGNVAWQIAKHLRRLKKYSITVYNHRANPLLIEFKQKLKCNTEVGLKNVIGDADYYFVCVSDKAIASTARCLKIKNPHAILCHTSGSMKLMELGERIHGTGVFYPLQTFSRNDAIDWTELPIIIEGNSKGTELNLLHLASEFSNRVKVLPFKQRLRLHLAAVMVNNFTNALYVEAKRFVDQEMKQGEFDLLLPLIEKTTSKLRVMAPLDAQTGPAKRGDLPVMRKHMDLLTKSKELKKVYKQLSRLIADQQKLRKV